MDDVEATIREQRNPIERIAQRIPGFRGYTERENRREADRLVRMWGVARLDHIISELHEATKRAPLGEKHDCQECVNQAEKLQAELRHADRGYSGFFSEVKWDRPENLAALHDHDLHLADALEALAERVADGELPVAELREELRALQRGLAERRHTILSIGGE